MALTIQSSSGTHKNETNPFYWIIRLENQHKTMMNRVLRPFGLDVPSWLVLNLLQAQGESSMSALATQTSANLSTMTKTVYRLQNQGLVATQTSLNDARVTNVHLTDTGSDLLGRCEQKTAPLIERGLYGFNAPQLQQLNQQLERLLANLF